ncbi:hypothetical protein GOP47_0030936 [Adiantum capillus-veneris]|nr:hypothetical protein GOP47_0030936 [Adiantum capillus-veneris]
MAADLAVALMITGFALYHKMLWAAVCEAITWGVHRPTEEVMLTGAAALTAAWLLRSRACAGYTLLMLLLPYTLAFEFCSWEFPTHFWPLRERPPPFRPSFPSVGTQS